MCDIICSYSEYFPLTSNKSLSLNFSEDIVFYFLCTCNMEIFSSLSIHLWKDIHIIILKEELVTSTFQKPY